MEKVYLARLRKLPAAHLIDSSALPDKLFHPRHQPIITYVRRQNDVRNVYVVSDVKIKKVTLPLKKGRYEKARIIGYLDCRSFYYFLELENRIFLKSGFVNFRKKPIKACFMPVTIYYTNGIQKIFKNINMAHCSNWQMKFGNLHSINLLHFSQMEYSTFQFCNCPLSF